MKLDELDYDFQVHENRFKMDHKLVVRFFKEVMLDVEASKEAGHKKFRDAVMIQIMVPGDRRQIVVREVREDDKQRFGEKYEKFMANEQVEVDGYPISQWPAVTRAQAEELKYLGFHTVENLAETSEAVMSKYPGLREISRRASAFITAQNESAPVEKLQTQIDDLAKQNEVLQMQLREFMSGAGKTAEHAVAAAKVASKETAKAA